MNIIGASLLSAALTAAVLLWFLPDQGERCETIVAQERAGWTAKIDSLEGQVQHLKLERLAASVEAFSNHAKYVASQRELAGRLAQDVVIPEPRAIPVSQLEPIDSLAARLTPVEAKAKEEVKQSGGWINVPWLKEQIWRGAAAYGMRGK